MKTTLIITTYNWPQALELVLLSVKKQFLMPDEVIIADDGSTSETEELIKKISKDFPVEIKHVWQNDEGFRAAMIRNKAIAKSEGDYIIGIDGDMILHPLFIKDHIKNAKKNRYIQGSRVLLSEEKTKTVLKNKQIIFHFFERGLLNRKNAIHSDFLSKLFSKNKKTLKGSKTCNFSMFKEDILKINGFDNEFVGWGREDSEFLARFLNSGGVRYDLKFNAIAYHIFHEENERRYLKKNEDRLKKTVNKKIKVCENGINKFLGE
jgi:glycosyltransferase involved in cell wall biosynthesis